MCRSPGVPEGKGGFSLLTSSLEESRCIDLLSLLNCWNLVDMFTYLLNLVDAFLEVIMSLR